MYFTAASFKITLSLTVQRKSLEKTASVFYFASQWFFQNPAEAVTTPKSVERLRISCPPPAKIRWCCSSIPVCSGLSDSAMDVTVRVELVSIYGIKMCMCMDESPAGMLMRLAREYPTGLVLA